MVIIAAVNKKKDQASEVVSQARSLAEAYDDSVHVVHVLSGPEFISLERTNVDETGDALDINQVRSVAKEITIEVTDNLNSPHEMVGLMGNPADSVVEYAEEHDARYLVIGRRKRSPVGKAVFGSVAQSIILQSDRPVVIATGS